MTGRKGSGAILLVVLIVGAGVGLVAMSPDMAQDVLPPQMLPMLPQFEKVETSRSCDTIERGTEYWNNLPFEDVSTEDARRFFCTDKCGGEQKTVGGYCIDGDLACTCRTEPGQATGGQ